MLVRMLFGGVLFLSALAAPFFPNLKTLTAETKWTMLNVCTEGLQADAHLLQFPDGKNILIDAGNPNGQLVKHLKSKRVHYLESVVITHLHKDHYLGLYDLLKSGIGIGQVYLTLPSREICDKEKPWGCDFEETRRLYYALKVARIPVDSLSEGQLLYSRGDISLRVLAVSDGVNTPIGRMVDVNDMSPVIRLRHGSIRFLFTGDLNESLGKYYIKSLGAKLEADVLKVPHHGAESTVPNEFFDRVRARAAIVPAPPLLFQKGERCDRVRKYLEEHQIPASLCGPGNVEIRTDGNTFEVGPEKMSLGRLFTSLP